MSNITKSLLFQNPTGDISANWLIEWDEDNELSVRHDTLFLTIQTSIGDQSWDNASYVKDKLKSVHKLFKKASFKDKGVSRKKLAKLFEIEDNDELLNILYLNVEFLSELYLELKKNELFETDGD